MNAGILAIVVCCLFATSIEPILVKIGFLGGASPILFIIVRTLIAATSIFLFGAKKAGRTTLVEYKKVLPLALLYFVTNGLTTAALIYSNPSLVITIIKLTPVGVGISSYFFGTDRVDRRFWAGVAFCLAGISATIDAQLSSNMGDNVKGILLSFLAVLSSTSYRTLLGQRTKEISPRTISYCVFTTNGFIALMLLPFFYKGMTLPLVSISLWTGIAAACANVAFVYAVKHLGPARMSVIDLLQRPAVVVLSMFILSEPITFKQLVGLLLVVLGVYLANSRRKIWPTEEGRPVTTEQRQV